MTSSSAWKKLERFWANLHGAGRTGPRGQSVPDVDPSIGLGIECKFQSRRTLNKADIEQADANARALGLPWILILHTKGKQHLLDDLIVMPPKTYLALTSGMLRFDDKTRAAMAQALYTIEDKERA